MKKLTIAVALAALVSAAPALAKEKSAKATGEHAAGQSAAVDENANREKNADGTFQGKPVVQGPADWSSAAAGASSGEAGSDHRAK